MICFNLINITNFENDNKFIPDKTINKIKIKQMIWYWNNNNSFCMTQILKTHFLNYNLC